MILTLVKDDNVCPQIILLGQASFLGQIFELVMVASDISIFDADQITHIGVT